MVTIGFRRKWLSSMPPARTTSRSRSGASVLIQDTSLRSPANVSVGALSMVARLTARSSAGRVFSSASSAWACLSFIGSPSGPSVS
jgi:hypothetical protein